MCPPTLAAAPSIGAHGSASPLPLGRKPQRQHELFLVLGMEALSATRTVTTTEAA
jgi:hypothetical protein